MNARIQSRLAKLERHRGDQGRPDRSLTFTEAFGLPLCRLLEISDRIPASPPPTGPPPNLCDVDAYLAQLERDGE